MAAFLAVLLFPRPSSAVAPYTFTSQTAEINDLALSLYTNTYLIEAMLNSEVTILSKNIKDNSHYNSLFFNSQSRLIFANDTALERNRTGTYANFFDIANGGSVIFEGAASFKENVNIANDEYAYGGTVRLQSSSFLAKGALSFEGNRGEMSGGMMTGYYGGAIALNRSTFQAMDVSTFTNNIAEATGNGDARGGVFFVENDSALVFDKAATFTGNQAVTVDYLALGGALFADWSVNGSSFMFNDSVDFSGNKATSQSSSAMGGAFSFSNSTFEVKGEAMFNGNIVTSTSVNGLAQGGAIVGGYLTFGGNTTFKNNQALQRNIMGQTGSGSAMGGAVYNTRAFFEGNATFEGNLASACANEAFGGSVFISSAGVFPFTITGKSEFKNNTVESISVNAGHNVYGGAIYATGANVVLTFGGDATFENNAARQRAVNSYGGGAQGGAIYIGGGASAFFEGQADFKQNILSANGVTSGGAIYATGAGTNLTFLGDALFFKQQVTSERRGASGGVIYAENLTATGGISFTNVTFDQNKVNVNLGFVSKGGVVYLEETPFTVTGSSTFTKNEFVINSSTPSLGGVIYAAGTESILTFGPRTAFSQNKIQNNSQAMGGVIYAELGASSIFNGSVLFDLNNSSGYRATYGGAVYLDASPFHVTGESIFVKNVAASNGNDAANGAFGGAIFATNALSVLTFDMDARFEENKAQQKSVGADGGTAMGGAIYAEIDADVTFKSGATFVDNESSSTKNEAYGGAIYGDGMTLSVAGASVFERNKATGDLSSYGGAGYLLAGSSVAFKKGLAVANNTVSSTNGDAYGGAFYLDNSSLSATGAVVFSGNAATGGAADAAGGAVYLQDGVLDFTASGTGEYILFENNTANGTGNSIYFAGNSSLTMDTGANDATFKDPLAGEAGKGSLSITGSGRLYLYGDSSGYTGTADIKGTTRFYLLSEDNDPANARMGGTVHFEDGTWYRPQVNGSTMAHLGGVTVSGKAQLAPYGVSALLVGSYTYTENTAGLTGYDNALSSVTPGASTSVVLKQGLSGYQRLPDEADAYRLRTDLTLQERDAVDMIYVTGVVSKDFLDMFTLLAGGDYLNYEQTQRTSVRTFNRQVVSRIHNRNQPIERWGSDRFNRDHFWMSAGYSWINQDDTSDGAGYTFNPLSFAVGYDFDIVPKEFTFGAAFGFSYGTAKTRSGETWGENDIRSYMLSFYGKYKPFRFYASGLAGGGIATNDTYLRSSLLDAKGSYNTETAFIQMEIGYDLGNEGFLVEPFIGAEYSFYNMNSYTEKGAGARSFGSNALNVFETPAGLRVAYDMRAGNYLVTPSLNASYTHNFGETRSATQAYFVGNSADTWRVYGGSDERDGMRAGFNLKVNDKQAGFAINLGYSLDYKNDFTDQQAYATVRVDF